MQCQVKIGDPLVSDINSVSAPFGLCTFCSSGLTMQWQVLATPWSLCLNPLVYCVVHSHVVCSGGFTMLSVRYSRDIDTELQ